MPKRLDLEIGSKHYSWTVLENIYNTGTSVTKVKVRCDCGFIHITSKYAVKNGYIKECFSCSQAEKALKRRKGVSDMSGYYWMTIIKNAEVRNMQVNITKEYAYDIYLQQNKLCALSGLEITMDNYTRNSGTASLDRIDSLKGYEIGNIQWVHKDINIMKNNHSDEDFINICILVADYKNKKNK